MNNKQVIPQSGRRYTNDKSGLEVELTVVDGDTVVWESIEKMTSGTIYDGLIDKLYTFKPANDLEWLAVNAPLDNLSSADININVARRGESATFGDYRYLQDSHPVKQVIDKRNELFGETEMKPKMKVSYDKVGSDLAFWEVAKEHDECGCFYYLFDGEQSDIKLTSITVLASHYKNKNLYRRIETPVTWQEAVTDFMESDSKCEDTTKSYSVNTSHMNDCDFILLCHLVASMTDKPE